MVVESEPNYAKELFGDQIDLARAYVKLLARDSDTFGLLGPRELPQLWSRHVLSSALLSELLVAGQKVVDIGSGAGLPGIPWQSHRLIASSPWLSPWRGDQIG